MQFKKITKKLLCKLKMLGYNILTFNNKMSSDHIIWFPEYVDDVSTFISNLDRLGVFQFDEPNILLIDHVIEHFEEYELSGEVLTTNELSLYSSGGDF